MARWARQIFGNPDAALRTEISRLVREQRLSSGRKIPAGSLVEFLTNDGLTCGVVWPHPANGIRYLILDQRGRRMWMLRKRLLHISNRTIPTNRKQQAVDQLRDANERRAREASRLDLATLWDVVRTAPGSRGWTLAELADLLLSEDAGDDRLAALLRALWSGSWFERKGNRWHVLGSAVVSRRRQAADDRQKQEEELDRSGAWVRSIAAGQVEAARASDPSVDRDRVISLLTEAALATDDIDPSSAAASLMARAHLHGTRAAFDVLVKLGHWSAEENLQLHRRGIPVQFSSQALADAAKIADQRGIAWLPMEGHCRRWWRRPWGLVAAGERTCSRAYALRRTLRGSRLTVFVAAPALLVEEGGSIDNEACLRGTSIILPDRRLAMFPPEILSAAGFIDGELKPAIAVDFSLNESLEPEAVRLSLRRVRCHVADEMPDSHRALSGLAQRLRSARLARALMPVVDFPQVKVDDGELRIDSHARTNASIVDEELSYLASSAIGSWCHELGVPCIYSARGAGSERDGEGRPPAADVGNPLPTIVRHHHLQRHLSHPSLQMQPDREEALGIDSYARFSSPLDRYEDLTVQRQLISMIVDSRPLYREEELRQSLAKTASAREAAAAAIGEGRRYWALKALEQRAGEELEAIVIERAGLGYSVVITLVGCSGYVPVIRELWAETGDRLRVRIEQVSARRDLLRLSVDEKRQPSRTTEPSQLK